MQFIYSSLIHHLFITPGQQEFKVQEELSSYNTIIIKSILLYNRTILLLELHW